MKPITLLLGSRLPAAERTRTFRTDGRFREKGILECKYPLDPLSAATCSRRV